MNIATARITYAGPGRFDIMRTHNRLTIAEGYPFAPSLSLLLWGKDEIAKLDRLRRIPLADVEELDRRAASLWAKYRDAYLGEMRDSFLRFRARWDALVAGPDRVALCACTNPLRCHRTVLARDILPKLGAAYVGELDSQTTIPGA